VIALLGNPSRDFIDGRPRPGGAPFHAARALRRLDRELRPLDSDYDHAVLEHVQVLKLADEEAQMPGDVATLPVPEVVVTHGARGATVYVAGVATRVPAFALTADPTGAGDAFAIAYAGARSRGVAPVAAARRATTAVADMLAA